MCYDSLDNLHNMRIDAAKIEECRYKIVEKEKSGTKIGKYNEERRGLGSRSRRKGHNESDYF